MSYLCSRSKKEHFQCYDLCGTCLRTLATFQTVGIEKAYFLSSAVVGRELHRADTGTHLALHLTGAADVDVGKRLGDGLSRESLRKRLALQA